MALASTTTDFGDDLLTVDFLVNEDLYDPLLKMVGKEEAEELVDRIDRILFGKKGSIAESIKGQAGRGGFDWPPLTSKYAAYKARLKQSGQPIPGEVIPPRTVKSTKTWIRTGKFLEFAETRGEGRFKKVVIFPEAILRNEIFMEVFVDQISYWAFADQIRPIAAFTDDDEDKINRVFLEWIEGLIIRKLERDSVEVPG